MFRHDRVGPDGEFPPATSIIPASKQMTTDCVVCQQLLSSVTRKCEEMRVVREIEKDSFHIRST
jgi:hypothetical protein